MDSPQDRFRGRGAEVRTVKLDGKEKKEKQNSPEQFIQDAGYAASAKVILDQSLDAFKRKGEKAVSENRARELETLGQVSVDLAVAVKRNIIGNEPAVIIARKYAGYLTPRQIAELAGVFPARRADEALADFDKRRLASRTRDISGLSKAESDKVKAEIGETMEMYNRIESAAIDKKTWPMRDDGQPRRSFIDRLAVTDIAIEAVAMQKAVLEGGSEVEIGVPSQISRHEQLLTLVDRTKPKAVTFDMFDTLVQSVSNVSERHEDMMDECAKRLSAKGFNVTSQEFRDVRSQVWYKYKKDFHGQGKEFRAVDAMAQIVRDLGARKGRKFKDAEIKELAQGLEEAFIAVESETNVVMPGVKSVLEGLKARGIKLGVISNHPYPQKSVEDLLRKFGLLDYFDNVTVSSEVGHIKSVKDPDCRIFKHALGKLGVGANETFHTGDNVRADQTAPAKMGVRGIVYNNPHSAQKRVEMRKLAQGTGEYAEESLALQKEFLTGNARDYFKRNGFEGMHPELEKYAMRLYEMSRDEYGPMVVSFADHTLREAAKVPGTMNLNTGRDALIPFLVQRQLLRAQPEAYPGVTKDQVKYMLVSREMMRGSSPADIEAYVRELGVKDGQKVTVVDNGIMGSTQSKLQKILPKVDFHGEYLYTKRTTVDPDKGKKHGYILEEDVEELPRGGPQRFKLLKANGALGKRTVDIYTSLDMVHLHEDVWNGVFQSPQVLAKHKDGRRRPRNWNNPTMPKLNDVPGNPDSIPGIDSPEGLLLMKRMAMKGVLDSLHIFKRQQRMDVVPTKVETIQKFTDWFIQHNQADTIDRRIMDGLARKRQ